MKKGFTLIELLVVITLIGILSVAVLSALNPIEQINKARDARKRADAAQLLQALDRYFASNEKFPWNNYATPGTDVDLAFNGHAGMVGVGICSDEAGDSVSGIVENSDSSGCAGASATPPVHGYLISSLELKGQFAKRDYFKTPGTVTALTDLLYVIKILDDPSVSICFVPSAKQTRDTWDDVDPVSAAEITKIKQLTWVGGVPTAVAQWPLAAGEPVWSVNTTAGYVCVPEE